MNTENRTPNYNTRTRGFTLAEAIMAMVVLGIAAAGVLLPFSGGAKVRAEGVRRTLAAKLASDLMEQIVSKPFHDPNGSSYYYKEGPDSGEATVKDFDNIDDFDGYSESQGHIISNFYTGAEFNDPMYANFGREVSCDYVYVPQQAPREKNQCNYIRVTVWVKYNGREIADIKRLIAK